MNVLDFFKGYVRFYGEGGFPERFLTESSARGLHVTDTKRQGETFFATIPAAEYARLRPLAKRACIRLRIYRKYGLYFRLFPYRKRVGVPVGLLLGAVLLYILSGRIWIVQVDTTAAVDTAAILQAVEKQGVYVGCRIKDVDMQSLRLHALSDLEEMVYVSVNPSGCVARVTVNKRDPAPDIMDFHDNFSNLVAARDGTILSTDVHSGQAAVKVGEGVSAGTLLVSGTVESAAGNLYLHRASGKIIAKTSRTLSAFVPFSEQQLQPTSTVVDRVCFRFLKWDMPLFSAVALPDTYRVEKTAHLLKTDTLTLPIGWLHERYTRLQSTTVTRSEAEAKTLAAQQLEQQLQDLAIAGVEVIETLQTTEQITKDGITITHTLQCVEDIAKEVPLQFADNSQKIPKN